LAFFSFFRTKGTVSQFSKLLNWTKMVWFFNFCNCKVMGTDNPGNPYWRGRISTIRLHYISCFWKWFFYKPCYLNKDFNCTELSPSVRCPCISYLMEQHTFKNLNSCLNANIYSYSETSCGQSSNLYLNVAHFFQHQC